MTDMLSRLVKPFTRDDFFRRYWTQQHLHIQRPGIGAYADITGLEDIDRFLQSERTSAAFFNVVSAGEPLGIEKWSRTAVSGRGTDLVAIPERLLDLYAAGATLVLNAAEKTIPSVGSMIRGLASEMGMRTWANVYITPPKSHGFARHGDTHEVLVLQVSGSKIWTIHHSDGREELVTLREGDALYIPRDLGHSAVCGEEPSVHITIGILPSYGFRIIEQLAEIAKAVPAFRRAAPPAFASGDEKQRYQRDFQEALQALICEVKPEELLDNLDRELALKQIQGWPGRFLDLIGLGRIQSSTVLQMTEGMIPRLDRTENQIVVRYASRVVRIPLFLEAALQQVLARKSFEVGSFRGMLTAQGKIELGRTLVREGLATIVRR